MTRLMSETRAINPQSMIGAGGSIDFETVECFISRGAILIWRTSEARRSAQTCGIPCSWSRRVCCILWLECQVPRLVSRGWPPHRPPWLRARTDVRGGARSHHGRHVPDNNAAAFFAPRHISVSDREPSGTGRLAAMLFAHRRISTG